MTVLYTDIDPFCCAVLSARVADGNLPHGDVLCADLRTLTPETLKKYHQIHLFAGIGASPLGLKWAAWPDSWSIVTGGFPCQDISCAGKGAGIDGSRSGLWLEMHRVIDIVRPDWVIAENVPALRTRGIDRVLGDLERIGYECWPLVVGADDVGAPHRRKRVWIVARMDDTQGRGIAGRVRTHDDGQTHRAQYAPHDAGCQIVAHATVVGCATLGAESTRQQRQTITNHALCVADSERGTSTRKRQPTGMGRRVAGQGPGPFGTWPIGPFQAQYDWEAPRLVRFAERGVGGSVDGLPGRLAKFANRHALRALGNAQVPQCVELIARAMMATGGFQ